MTLDKQKLIDAMAQAIRCVRVDDTLNAPHEYIIGSKILAAAALKALQDYLPSTKEIHDNNRITMDLWDELKHLWKD